MINFTYEDFKEANEKLETAMAVRNAWRIKLEEATEECSIAREERNFIGDWLIRNGVSEEQREEIEEGMNPITF